MNDFSAKAIRDLQTGISSLGHALELLNAINKARVVTKTADFAPAIQDTGTTYIVNAADLTATLPKARPGLTYRFFTAVESTTTGFCLRPHLNNGIIGLGENRSPGQQLCNSAATDAVGDMLEAFTDGTNWFVMRYTGTWEDAPGEGDYEGFGAAASGGDGGDTYVVDTLNQSGTGSIDEAIQTASGPRTVRFDISGWIDLTGLGGAGWLKDDITIDGSTAPNGGIGFQNKQFTLNGRNNWIFKHVRFKRGDAGTNPVEEDSFTASSCTNLVFDHCSFAWGIDETLSFQNSDNITVVDCLIAEGLHDTGLHPEGAHSRGTTQQNCLGVTWQRCLWARNYLRNPVCNTGQYQIANCSMFDWYGPPRPIILNYSLGSPRHPYTDVNIESNYVKRGPNTISGVGKQVQANPSNPLFRPWYDDLNESEGESWENQADSWSGYARHDFPSLTLLTPTAAKDQMLLATSAGVGATLPKRDTHDQSIIDHFTNGTGTTPVDSQDDVGGFPDLTV